MFQQTPFTATTADDRREELRRAVRRAARRRWARRHRTARDVT